MSAEYGKVKLGKLKLKGAKKRSDPNRKRKAPSAEEAAKTCAMSEDEKCHGGWWSIADSTQTPLGCQVAFEWATHPHCYLAAMDNGKLTMGPPHTPGEGPSPEECFGLIAAPDCDWVSFKTGFDKYIGVDSQGQLTGAAEAVGNRERWELVFEDERAAVQSKSNSCFICLAGDKEGYIFASSRTAKVNEIIALRCNASRKVVDDFTPDADKKKTKDMETEYVKMYQHSKVDLKNRLHTTDFGDRSTVRQGRDDGNLHEVLLDRRMKTKSDKYC